MNDTNRILQLDWRSITIGTKVMGGFCSFASIMLTDVVETNKGPVRGEIAATVQNHVPYSKFNGIPYGKPPVGHLRFKAPVEVDGWTEPLITTSQSKSCPQLEFQTTNYIGDEDCLYLNVYTPKVEFHKNMDKLVAVMVWIHGGAFFFGSGGYNPDFLIEENVVVVSMNYRLGALGFLSLNHPNATGNAGMKDQVLVLKWVQRNIQNFGGDPDRVTIFGQSAGGASVEFHKLSKLSRGLFHTSIAMSGSALNPWSFSSRREALLRSFHLGAKLGIVEFRRERLLKKLYEVTAEELVRAVASMSKLLLVPFKPTYEDEAIAIDEVFISDCAVNIYKSGNFAELPHMLGFTGLEAVSLLSVAGRLAANPVYSAVKSAKTSFNIVNENFNGITNDIGNESYDSMLDPITIASNIAFVVDIDRTQQYLSRKGAPIYYYRNSFDYDSSLHKLNGVNLNGTGHADDIAHIFWIANKNQSLDSNSDIGIQRKKMTRMWTNFAKYGNPTPRGKFDEVLNLEWQPAGADGKHLAIGTTDYAMRSRPVDKFVKLVQRLIKPTEKIINGCPRRR